MRWPPVLEPPRSTEWRKRYQKYLSPLIHVPRCCDDVEVQAFLDEHFLMFNPRNVRSAMTGGQVLKAARKRFGDLRCDTVCFWEH